MSNKIMRILSKNEPLKKKATKRKRVNMKEFFKTVQSTTSSDVEFNASKKKIVKRDLNYSTHEATNIKSETKTSDKPNQKNIEKSINNTKNTELDSTNSSDMMKLIAQQRRNRKSKQK